jgi:hypothetical protein
VTLRSGDKRGIVAGVFSDQERAARAKSFNAGAKPASLDG